MLALSLSIVDEYLANDVDNHIDFIGGNVEVRGESKRVFSAVDYAETFDSASFFNAIKADNWEALRVQFSGKQ